MAEVDVAITPSWSDLRSIPAFTPLRRTGLNAQQVQDYLFQVGPERYVFAHSMNEELREDDERAPFVTLVFWSASQGAARRAALREIEADDAVEGQPPSELWAEFASPRYGDIVRGAKKHGLRSVERATYRNDGMFVHSVVSIGMAEFYFREVECDKDALPYAICIRLRRASGA